MGTWQLPDRFNLAGFILDHNLDAGRGGKVALRWRDEAWTYAQLADASHRLAHAFRELGLRPEERVLLALSDRPEFSHAWFATLRCGAVFAMVNPLLPPEDYAYYVEYSRARIAVVDAELAPLFAKLQRESRHLQHVVSVDQVAGLVAQAPATPYPTDTHKWDIAGWLFTSGSTGKPKAAVHFHEDFAFNIEHYARQVLGLRESDVTAAVPKLFFGYATGNNLMFPFAAGGSTVLFSERSTPETIVDVVQRYRPTILTCVPTMIGKLLEHDRERPLDFSCLRLVTSAGEKLPDGLHQQWLDRCGVPILDGIGSAEMFHVYVSNRPGAVRFGSLGLAVPGYDCRVVDDEGRALPRGEIGRLFVRGESTALCYWQDHEKSKATFAGDLMMSADLFRQDLEGFFFYEGRADDLLKVGGQWVAPQQIETCLLGHEAVAEVCVTGCADADGLVKPKAWVVTRGTVSVDALQAWVKSRLSPHKYPRWVEFLDELPRNDRGKIDRAGLKRRG